MNYSSSDFPIPIPMEAGRRAAGGIGSALSVPSCLDAFSKDTRTFAKPQVRLPGSIRVHPWRKKA